MHIIGVHNGLEERVCHIDDAENLTSPTVGQNLVHAWQGVRVHHCIGVQDAVVIHPPWQHCRINFRDQEHGGNML